MSLTEYEKKQFKEQGFLIQRGVVPVDYAQHLRTVVDEHLSDNITPVEYEVDVQYPGSPESVEEEGGQTIRRLLGAYKRHPLFKEIAKLDSITDSLKQLLESQTIKLSQCHHNCIMTKQPRYSSETHWHKDNRYWSFDEQNLISVWTALGDETLANGCLSVIPGSHLIQLQPQQLDERLFLIPEGEENEALIAQATLVELSPGDVLFFHSRLLHAAGKNQTKQVKYSLVYTYHEATNRPTKNTRSDSQPGIRIA